MIVQTILRSELIQWRDMPQDKLIEVLLLNRVQVLEDQSSDELDERLAGIDVAGVWGQAV
tara:strand:+ start:88 stop:267 length:180 start_codon:yes stop_codon:yes gene_type:complete